MMPLHGPSPLRYNTVINNPHMPTYETKRGRAQNENIPPEMEFEEPENMNLEVPGSTDSLENINRRIKRLRMV